MCDLFLWLVAADFSRSPKRSSGFGAGVFAVLEHVLSVHKNVANAD